MEEVELIKRYIQGQLSPEEKSAFEQQLTIDADLKREVERARLMIKGIAFSERDRLKTMLEQEKPSRPRYWYAVAAVIPLLIISFFLVNRPADPSAIYQEFYEPYGVYEFGQSRGTAETKDLERIAFEFYEEGEYEVALEKIKELQKEKPTIGYNLYVGICLLEMERLDEALDALREIQDSSKYYEISQWYQALAFIKQEKFDQARELLDLLSKGKNGLAIKSKAILDQL